MRVPRLKNGFYRWQNKTLKTRGFCTFSSRLISNQRWLFIKISWFFCYSVRCDSQIAFRSAEREYEPVRRLSDVSTSWRALLFGLRWHKTSSYRLQHARICSYAFTFSSRLQEHLQRCKLIIFSFLNVPKKVVNVWKLLAECEWVKMCRWWLPLEGLKIGAKCH